MEGSRHVRSTRNSSRLTRPLAAAMAVGSLLLLMAGGGCKFLKKEKKPFGQECSVDTDCESLSCSPYGKICSKSCTYDSECGGDLVCRDNEEGAGNICSKAIGAAPNGVCKTAADCQHGHCLKRVGEENEPGICSKFCQTPADCPAGMKVCVSISDSGLAKFCLPGDEKSPPPKFAPQPPKKITPKTDAGTALTATTTTTTTAPPVVDAGAPADAGKPADAGAPADAGKGPPPIVKPTATPKTPPPPKPKPG